MTNEISKVNKKKWERKRKRAQHIIERETNIKFSDTPTQNIVICNAGLVTGLTREIVVNECSNYGNITNVVMVPGQSFCFVQYDEISSAEKAMEAIHGQLSIGQNDAVIYLSFTITIPCPIIKNEFNKLPPGLTIIPNIITELEESELLTCVNSNKNSNDSSVSSMKHRQVKHFGYEFQYDTNNVDINKPLEQIIPPQCDILWEKLRKQNFYMPHKIDQLTVNIYKPGQGIPPHVDTHSAFESPIYSLSLGSDVVMEFKDNNKRHYSILLPQRSLLIMDGEARFAWTHGITPRTMDTIESDFGLTVQKRATRTSFTFRSVRKDCTCHCPYPDYCDSQKIDKNKENISKSPEILNEVAAQLEATHVHDVRLIRADSTYVIKVYEQIASHFSETRHKPWPNVQKFVEDVAIGGILVDVGCGNGKYLNNSRYIAQLGGDRSEGLAAVCRTRGFEIMTCDCLYLPLRDNIADAVISIAVIHHLANEKRRLQAVQQIVRILKRNGTALIYVWAKNQAAQNKRSNYLKKNDEILDDIDASLRVAHSKDCADKANELPDLPVHKNRTQFEHQDLLVPWKLKSLTQNLQKTDESDSFSGEKTINEDSEIFLRYYHVFEEGELEKLCCQIYGVVIQKSFYDQGNWCVILKKIA